MSGMSGDAAEQVVRMTLESAETAIRLMGSGARHLAVLLYAVFKNRKRTKGKLRLTNMLRSGKELKVFAVRDRDLKTFCAEAKRYGVLYTVLKDRTADDGRTDVMVRAEDAGKVNRIFERYKLSTVETGEVRADREEKTDGARSGPVTYEEKTEQFLDEILRSDTEHTENPIRDRTAASRQSGPSSMRSTHTRGDTKEETERRVSVRRQLEEFRREESRERPESEKKPQEIGRHHTPKKKREKRRKEAERA